MRFEPQFAACWLNVNSNWWYSALHIYKVSGSTPWSVCLVNSFVVMLLLLEAPAGVELNSWIEHIHTHNSQLMNTCCYASVVKLRYACSTMFHMSKLLDWNIVYSQLQRGWHRILRVFLKLSIFVPGVPGFSWDLSSVLFHYVVLIVTWAEFCLFEIFSVPSYLQSTVIRIFNAWLRALKQLNFQNSGPSQIMLLVTRNFWMKIFRNNFTQHQILCLFWVSTVVHNYPEEGAILSRKCHTWKDCSGEFKTRENWTRITSNCARGVARTSTRHLGHPARATSFPDTERIRRNQGLHR